MTACIGAIAAVAMVAPEIPRFELEWDAPSLCADEAQMRSAIASRLSPPSAGEESRVRARGVVSTRDQGVLELRLELQQGETVETQVLTSSDCSTLEDAAQLLVAMAVDPLPSSGDTDAAANPGETLPSHDQGGEPSGAAGDAVRGAPAPPVVDETRTPGAPPAGPRLAIRALGGGQLGPLPLISAGAGLEVGLDLARSRFTVGASHWFARRQVYELDPDVGAAYWLWSFGARACLKPTVGPVEVPACVGPELGPLVGQGEGVGLEDARRRKALWAAVAAGVSVLWAPVPRFGLWAGVEGMATLARPSFRVANEHAYAPERAGFRMAAGVEGRFP